MPFIERQLVGRNLKILIDAGAAKNYILPVTRHFHSIRLLWLQSAQKMISQYIPRYTHIPWGSLISSKKKIKDLLENGIIRPSRSPYNNPTWVVDKKGCDEQGNKNKRMVIDFRKLNERTIADEYPLPNIPMILANLGKAKYFSTLDLKSGYHQIYLVEQDR